MRNFLIYSPAYTRKYGGIISLHKLCHLINSVGGFAYLHPTIDLIEVNALNLAEATELVQAQIYNYENFDFDGYFGGSGLNTPVRHILKDGGYNDDWIVVYPEVTFGNPLRARNVVRWLLHNPGFHSGRINYGQNELHVRFSSLYDEFHYPKSTLSPNCLTVVDFDFNLYNTEGAAEERVGTAYCVRKGFGKPVQHDLDGSVLIDNLSQEEIAKTFKTVKTFYSYDPRTAYSSLAVLCGCDSVVIPDEGVSERDWLAGEDEAFGIAYGAQNIERARRTAHLVKPQLQQIKDRAVENVVTFMNEAEAFFG